MINSERKGEVARREVMKVGPKVINLWDTTRGHQGRWLANLGQRWDARKGGSGGKHCEKLRQKEGQKETLQEKKKTREGSYDSRRRKREEKYTAEEF